MIDKEAKRKHDLEVRRKYEAKERRQRRILWALFFLVMTGLVLLLYFQLRKPGPTADTFKMPFIEQRHEQLKQSNPDIK